jgi:hypothetical protein
MVLKNYQFHIHSDSDAKAIPNYHALKSRFPKFPRSDLQQSIPSRHPVKFCSQSAGPEKLISKSRTKNTESRSNRAPAFDAPFPLDVKSVIIFIFGIEARCSPADAVAVV